MEQQMQPFVALEPEAEQVETVALAMEAEQVETVALAMDPEQVETVALAMALATALVMEVVPLQEAQSESLATTDFLSSAAQAHLAAMTEQIPHSSVTDFQHSTGEDFSISECRPNSSIMFSPLIRTDIVIILSKISIL